jgi:hypothetical protein
MKKVLISILIILLFATPALSAENLLTYGKADPNNRLVVTESRVTHADMKRNDGSTLLSKDKGAGAIVEATTLDVILFHSSASGSLCNHSIWANENKSYQNLLDDGDEVFYIQDGKNATGFFTAIASLNLGGGFDLGYYAANTPRLTVTSRSGQTYTMIVYNSITTGSGVLDTLSFSPVDTLPTTFRYHIAASNVDDNGGSLGHYGYAENYTFNGLAGTTVRTHLGYPQVVF